MVKVVRLLRKIALIGALLLIATGPLYSQKKGTKDSNRTKSLPQTPLDAYKKVVTDIIGSRWYANVRNKVDMITVGKLTMNFRIMANGRVTSLKVLSNTSNEVFSQICRAAVLESKFPPIPEAVRRQTHQDFIDWEDVNFIMYPN